MIQLLLLSGPVAVGKSAIAQELVQVHGFQSIRTGAFLAQLAARQGQSSSRADLQRLGDAFDRETDYRWLIDNVAASAMREQPKVKRWLLDSVRKKRQVEHFRDRFGQSVLHVHLTAAEQVLRSRYELRLSAGTEYVGNTSYDAAVAHPNEISARSLIEIADAVIDVSQASIVDIASTIFKKSIERGEHAASHTD